jgi:hypothetical protein
MCEHPKKDLANGDRFVDPLEDYFILFFQLCEVGGLRIVPNRNEPNLAQGQTRQSNFF